ncbi:glycosyltransferase family 39 protein [Cohnella candidum]|uniref:Nucleoporin-interacting protein n=1 Tax=Cohnella candidum TaxID=2674991 RepID=A0A3G3K1F9_9BACL|nr:glycosyltransferase family 39 protein [Cohnella candidum]AYQ74210.1 nucleoporin-interacting protein [Cohnella candidum]
MRGAWAAKIGWAICAVLLIAYAAFGALLLSPWAASWDEVDFVLALDRFDLLAMQPHAPGYPYFVLGGQLIRSFIEDPVKALGGWNLLLACTSAFAVYRIGRRWLTIPYACLAAAIVLTVPMNWTLAVRPMSDGAALAILWWYLWSLVRLAEKRSSGRWLVAAFLFGLLMGTRLSYVPFGIGLLIIWAGVWRDARLSVRAKAARLTGWAAAVSAFQFLWVFAVGAAEGSLAETLRLFAGFGEGHFTEWGGGVAQPGLPLGERIWRFAADNWLWTGLFARSAWLAAAAGLLLAWTVWAAYRRKPSNRLSVGRLRRFAVSPAGILIVCAIAYALWALLGQNIAKTRHIAPLAAMSIFALAVCAGRLKAAKPVTAVLLTVLALVQTAEGARLVVLQHKEEPAVYQLADASAQDVSPSTVLYTWEEERVLRYLNVPVETRPIFTYSYFLANIEAERNARILLTGSVWEEFRKQADLPDTKVRRLGAFQSDDRLDPVYGKIELYEWIR